MHFFATAALAGLIWTIQVVHYPLFDHVERERFVQFERSHSSRIALIVGPLMGVELISALLIAIKRPTGVSLWLGFVSLVVLAVVHLTTVLCSVPAHATLGRGFDAGAHQRLVTTNWIRTVGWTTRAVMAGYMLSLFVTSSGAVN